MDDLLRIFGPVVAIFLASIIGQFIQKKKMENALKNMPEYSTRKVLIQDIRAMRSSGASFQKVQAHLVGKGIRKSIAKMMITDVENEEDPDVNNALPYSWNQFNFVYPGNWKVVPFDKDISLKDGVAIETGSSAFVFLLNEATFKGDTNFESNLLEMLEQTSQKSISEYYSILGTGYEVKGTEKSTKIPGCIIFFRPSLPGNEKFLLVDYISLEDEAIYNVGMDLFRNSFSQQEAQLS